MCASAHPSPPRRGGPGNPFLVFSDWISPSFSLLLLLLLLLLLVNSSVQSWFCRGGFLVMIRTEMGGEQQRSGDTEDPKPVDASGGGGGERCESGSSMGDSLMSDESSSCSSSELAEDASSSTSCSSSSSSSSSSTSLSNCRGPLYELSELMTRLPIKRGLSEFYQGKSQSFTSLARVQSIEDLVKKENPYRKRLKTCESFAGALDKHSQKSYSPRPTISKKSSISKGSFLSSSSLGKRGPSVASLAMNPSPCGQDLPWLKNTPARDRILELVRKQM